MDCLETQTLLSAFHDGELPDGDRARVETHLRGCPDCGRLLADLARADEAAGVPDPGPAYWSRFNARVAGRIDREAEGTKAAVLRPKQGWMRQQLRFLLPAVAAAALVVVVVRLGGRDPVAPTPTHAPQISVEERKAAEPAEQRMAKTEMEPPAEGKRNDAAVSRRPPVKSYRAAETPAAPPSSIITERFPAAAREERDEPADRLRSERKEMTSEKYTVAPPAIGAPSPPPLPADRNATAPPPPVAGADRILMKAQEEGVRTAKAAPQVTEPQPAAEEESASDVRTEKDRLAAEASREMSMGKARAKAGPEPLASDSAGSASPCETAKTLAARERFREAEAAQRECLAMDPSPLSQEKGLIFLAELLDRQARFAEADEVLTEAQRQFPKSLPLDLYRQQRPMVQKQQMPVPVPR